VGLSLLGLFLDGAMAKRALFFAMAVVTLRQYGTTACTCSPFSGNQGSCCPDGADTCSHWGETLSCTGGTPTCCNSDFASVCCPENSACSQGCRDSLLGSCDCIPLRESRYNETDALYSLAFVAASQCTPEAGLNNTWACTACPASMPLQEVTVVQNEGHQALVGYDESRGAAVVALRGSLR
jgi:hypothetical protein